MIFNWNQIFFIWSFETVLQSEQTIFPLLWKRACSSFLCPHRSNPFKVAQFLYPKRLSQTCKHIQEHFLKFLVVFLVSARYPTELKLKQLWMLVKLHLYHLVKFSVNQQQVVHKNSDALLNYSIETSYYSDDNLCILGQTQVLDLWRWSGIPPEEVWLQYSSTFWNLKLNLFTRRPETWNIDRLSFFHIAFLSIRGSRFITSLASRSFAFAISSSDMFFNPHVDYEYNFVIDVLVRALIASQRLVANGCHSRSTRNFSLEELGHQFKSSYDTVRLLSFWSISLFFVCKRL